MDERAAGSTDGRRGDGGRRREAVRRTMADPAEVARLFSALPPAAPEAEMSLLGSMLIDPKMIPDVVGIVADADDFAKPAAPSTATWSSSTRRPRRWTSWRWCSG
jgi:hypothetical protein